MNTFFPESHCPDIKTAPDLTWKEAALYNQPGHALLCSGGDGVVLVLGQVELGEAQALAQGIALWNQHRYRKTFKEIREKS